MKLERKMVRDGGKQENLEEVRGLGLIKTCCFHVLKFSTNLKTQSHKVKAHKMSLSLKTTIV